MGRASGKAERRVSLEKFPAVSPEREFRTEANSIMCTITQPTKSSTQRLAVHIAAKLALNLDLDKMDMNGFMLVIEDIHDAILEALPMMDFVELQRDAIPGKGNDPQLNSSTEAGLS